MISVIIPCYNVSNWIDRCLESIVSQTMGLEQLEIICVDDCSTDDTLSHLKAWEQRYPDVFLLVESAVNGRQGTARNIGLSYASGEWIAFVDSDDWVEKDYLEKLHTVASDGEYDIVCCGNHRDSSTELSYFSEADRYGGEEKDMFVFSPEERKQLIHTQALTLSVWGKIIRRSFLVENDIWFPENLAYEDIYWGGLLHLYAGRIHILGEKLYHYFVNPKSTILGKRSDYHTDMLTVQSLLFREIRRRGFADTYGAELEYEYVYTCVLAFLKILALRFEEPSYSLYQLLQAFTKDHYPDLMNNVYIVRDGIPELHSHLLHSVFVPLRKKEFLELMSSLKQIGI